METAAILKIIKALRANAEKDTGLVDATTILLLRRTSGLDREQDVTEALRELADEGFLRAETNYYVSDDFSQ